MENAELRTKRLEFLNETINFYNSNNRCIDDQNGGCFYYMEGKVGCAIGRHVEDKELCKEFDKYNQSYVGNDNIFNKLPTDLKMLGMDFLLKIQELHDYRNNWDENGITTAGLGAVNCIKIKYNLNG